MKFLRIVISFLVIAGGSGSCIASHGGNGQPPVSATDLCSPVNQLPKLDCASAPNAVFSKSGRLWIVWSYAGHVYVSYSDNKARTYSAPVAVNRIPEAISARGENRPKIAINNKGGIYVSWTTPLKKRFSGNIRFSYSADNAKHFSQPITVNDNLDITGHRFDALQVADNGDIYLAWLDKRDRLKADKENIKYHGAAVYYTWSDDGGKSFHKNRKIIDHSCECCRVVMDIDKQDLPVILWRNIYGKNTRDHALVSFNSAAEPAEPVRVSYDNWQVDACPHHGPSISISDSDDYHMVWFNNAPESHGLFYSRLRNKKQSKPLNFGNYKATASHPDVLSSANKVWLTWKEFDGKQETLWIKKSDDNGNSWNKPEIIARTLNGSDYPFLLTDGTSIYLQWKTTEEGYQLLKIDNTQQLSVGIN